jgi:lipoprotein-anchoring transpeptidase ErfK/SrfK
MDVYQPERKQRGQARERFAARQRKQMVTRSAPEVAIEKPVMSRAPYDPGLVNTEVFKGRALVVVRDVLWYINHNVFARLGLIALVVVIVGLFLGTHLIGGRLFPNVWALNTNLGEMSLAEAAATLQTKWMSGMRIQLRDGDRVWAATPAQIGLSLDAAATVEAARNVGMAGMPFGYSVMPVVNMDLLTSQNFFLDLTEQSKVLPYNAGFEWQGEDLVGKPGTDGRFLDVAATISNLQSNLSMIGATGVFDLVMSVTPPEVRDPSPYLANAKAFASQPAFLIKGYDPFTDEHFAWSTDRTTLTSWLEVDENGLGLRRDVFAGFVQAQTASLAQTDAQRFIEPNDAMEKLQTAINDLQSEVNLRVRYRPTTYTIEYGDNGYFIARAYGVPLIELQKVNPGIEWENLTAGQVINLPSPDMSIPLDPVPNKRIVVNLETQSMVAYENGQPVFSWLIASGMDRAPTSPGTYQILSHAEKATGGSSELCSALGCAQWEMDWFMGIYEVIPGLINGFHGNVLLANGRLLGDGNTGQPLTYGCIMANNDNAKALYDWAEEGTIVEILSPIYPPRSELGRQMLAQQPPAA